MVQEGFTELVGEGHSFKLHKCAVTGYYTYNDIQLFQNRL